MSLKHHFPAAVLFITIAAALPAAAESFASSASSAGSASSASVSDSIEGSSDSSSRNDKVADGDYRIVDVAEALPGKLRLTLEPVDVAGAAKGFVLILPVAATGPDGFATGDVLRAATRPYGIEFARAATREPFFLVLADDWHRDLASKRVAL